MTLCFSRWPLGEAVLSADDKDRGVVLVDIGGGTTDIAVFVQGGIWHTSVIPVGGNHFTNDIVLVQQTPHNTAEYLKLRYGSAISEEPRTRPPTSSTPRALRPASASRSAASCSTRSCRRAPKRLSS